MSVRRTLGDMRAAIAKTIGCCSTDDRVVDYVNEATEILMQPPEPNSSTKWVGTYQRYRICADPSGCITWPREIETIEAWALCDCPGIVRNQWYEFQQNGPGPLGNCNSAGLTLVDRGQACTFDDTQGDPVQIKVYADVAEDADAKILLQGYDENANWIRTFVGGEWIDGEYVAISTTPTLSVKKYLKPGVLAVQKPITNGVVRIYAYNPTTFAVQALAIYEPDETRPMYRRSLIPNLEGMACDGGCHGETSDTECTKKQVTVMAKLRYIPVRNDNDWLLISNRQALKLMVQSLLKFERNLFQEAQAYQNEAMKALKGELSAFEGDGAVVTPRFQDKYVFGGGGVMNILA